MYENFVLSVILSESYIFLLCRIYNFLEPLVIAVLALLTSVVSESLRCSRCRIIKYNRGDNVFYKIIITNSNSFISTKFVDSFYKMILFSVVVVLIFSVFLHIILWVNAHLSLRRKLELVPGPKAMPFIGLAFELRKIATGDVFKWVMDSCFQYKNGMVIMWMGTEPVVHLRKPHQIEVILRSQTLIKKSRIYDFLANWLGNGLLTSTGDIWHKNRRLIIPAFHFNILDEVAEIISHKVDILNDTLKSLTERFPQKPINIFPLAIKFTLDAVCQTVMGVDMDLQRQEKMNTSEPYINLQS